MTVLELKKHIDKLVENGNGNDEFIVSFRDHFKAYGCDAKTFSEYPFMSNGYGQTRLSVSLINKVEKGVTKYPNITYRK